jgi:hypothetical protein
MRRACARYSRLFAVLRSWNPSISDAIEISLITLFPLLPKELI